MLYHLPTLLHPIIIFKQPTKQHLLNYNTLQVYKCIALLVASLNRDPIIIHRTIPNGWLHNVFMLSSRCKWQAISHRLEIKNWRTELISFQSVIYYQSTSYDNVASSQGHISTHGDYTIGYFSHRRPGVSPMDSFILNNVFIKLKGIPFHQDFSQHL